jgi:cobalt-zinc-cadmium efflux system outer membrane protein
MLDSSQASFAQEKTATNVHRHARATLLAAASLLLAMPAAPARAQAPQKINLQTALELAERQNLDLLAARARTAVAEAGVKIAGQRPNPTASVGVLRDSPHESLFFDQPLELGGKRQRRIEVAQQEGKLTDVAISALERLVRREVRDAFYTLALARAITAQHAQALQLAQRLQQIAQTRFESGDVPQLELIQAELEVSRAEAQLRVSQQEETVSLSRFNALLDEPAATRWELAGSLEDAPPALALPELEGRAYQSNPELQRLAQEEMVERSRNAWLRADRIPNLGLEFGTDYNAPRDFRVGPRGQLSIMLPIFTRNQGEIAQSLANQRVLEGETLATKRAVAGHVEEAYLELSARQTQVELYRKTLVPVARRLEGMAEESYQAGKANILTVLDAQRNVQQVEREYLDSLFAMQGALAALEETVGAPLE